MPIQLKLLSVNVGRPKTIQIGTNQTSTGIYKVPTEDAVAIEKLGLANDYIGNTKHHGGVDQAVYLYSAADYAWWSEEIGRDLPFAIFGENLTLDHFPDQPLRVGDRFQINNVLLEVTAPRIPCSTLSTRMSEPQFVKAFAQAKRYGAYTRVLQTGTVKQDDNVQYIAAPPPNLTVNDFFALFMDKSRPADQLQNALKSPIAIRSRELFESWLQQENAT